MRALFFCAKEFGWDKSAVSQLTQGEVMQLADMVEYQRQREKNANEYNQRHG